MEENQQTAIVSNEPETNSENSKETKISTELTEIDYDGQSSKKEDPSNLILGKFKSQEDLVNAYKELEKLQGVQSAELGNLRQNAVLMNNIQKAWAEREDLMNCEKEIKEAASKYNTPEYFQDPSFKAMYKEAYLALGKNLDSDRFINLLEGYVSSRLMRYQQEQAAKMETNKALGGVKFDKNAESSIKPVGKRLDEMSPQEIDDILDRLL